MSMVYAEDAGMGSKYHRTSKKLGLYPGRMGLGSGRKCSRISLGGYLAIKGAEPGVLSFTATGSTPLPLTRLTLSEPQCPRGIMGITNLRCRVAMKSH